MKSPGNRETKCCKGCGKEKPFAQFYRLATMADGFTAKCKDCTKAAVKANRENNIEHYLTYDRIRGERPERVAARKRVAAARAADPVKMERDIKSKQDWIARNQQKRAAHMIVGNAARDGDLIPPPKCERCGKSPINKPLHAHHEDYEKPLEVNWLCITCHGIRHREINAAKRKAAA